MRLRKTRVEFLVVLDFTLERIRDHPSLGDFRDACQKRITSMTFLLCVCGSRSKSGYEVFYGIPGLRATGWSMCGNADKRST
jgi:hypothetical protein